MDSKSSSLASSPSPTLLSTPGTPPETYELPQKQNLKELLESHDKVITYDDRIRAIIDASTERTEPMTFGQKRFWFLSHYVDDPTTFNIAYLGQLTGPIRIADLQKATEVAAQRHESLRTRFFWSRDDAKMPTQGILSKSLVTLETATIENEDQAIKELNDMRNHIWDFNSWVPLRLRLLSISDVQHYILIGTHHISMDGHSFPVLMLDIHDAYMKPSHRLPHLPSISQASAFGAHQRLAYESGKFNTAIEHHRAIFSDFDLARPIELFPFAKTQVRPSLDHYGTHVARIHLDATLTNRLKALARGRRATSFHAYLAALQALIFRLLPSDTTNQICIGIADANRIDKRFMGSIGNFLNVLPLKFDRKSKQTFGSAIEATRENTHTALKYSALPFDILLDELQVPRSNSWAPMFQVFMNYRLVVREHADKQWVGTKLGEERWHPALSGYDVAFEIMEDMEGAMLAVHVQKSIYDQEGAALLLRSYVALLREVARRGERIGVDRLPKWDEGDLKKALEIGKGSPTQLKWPATVAHRIDQMIERYPNSIALKDGFGHVLSYGEMNGRVNSIAQSLPQRSDNGKQPVIGVFQMPSADWICSLVAINRVGAVYLPLDLRVGVARLKSNVEVAQPDVLLVDDETLGRVGDIDINGTITIHNVSSLPASSNLKVETLAKRDEPAYLIFTSGSTGEPKGIVVYHAGLRANLEGYHSAWDVASLAGVVLQQAAFSFDASLLMIYAALTTGGTLLVVPADARGDPIEITRMMQVHGVTMTQATPSEYDMWFRFAPEVLQQCKSWKAAWFGGERAGPGTLSGFRETCRVLQNLKVFTSYGPTETTISAMKGAVDIWNPGLKVPIPGRLLPNYTAHIVDEAMSPMPIGVPGEILIGGSGVDANQYLGTPEQTAKAYLPDPFSAGGRIYRTGDFGRLDQRGFLTVEGRIAGDTQVKLRGYRIELTEIERVIAKEESCTQAVVTLRDNSFLVAHVVFDQDKQAHRDELMERLRARLPLSLPPFMCPSVIVSLKELPLTAHHKIDRRAVQEMALPEVQKAHVLLEAPRLSPTERRLAALWADILPPHALTGPINSRSDFFAAGGNSLLLVKLQAAMKSTFGDAPRLSTLMGVGQLGSMAALVDDEFTNFDWDKEIALDEFGQLENRKLRHKEFDQGFRILFTGATGFLGRYIISQLVKDPRVAQITCLVRGVSTRNLEGIFPILNEIEGGKLHFVETNLPALPNDCTLGENDTVVHCAADRTFWDGYGAAKLVNVDTVKSLAGYCVRSGATLHILSSGEVAAYEGDDGKQTARPNPADGYIASKWVVERFLSKLVTATGLSVTSHRPAAMREPSQQQEGNEETMARDMLSISELLRSRPDFAKLEGTIDVTKVEEVANAIATAVIQDLETRLSGVEASSAVEMRVATHPGKLRLQTKLLGSYMENLMGSDKYDRVRQLQKVPALHWVGMAKREDKFEWLITAMELIMKDEYGLSIFSKR